MPADTHNTGFLWRYSGGIHLNHIINVEVRYENFPLSKMFFADSNEYDPPSYNPFTLNSSTQNIEMLGQFNIPVYKKFGIYSLLGGSYTMRNDKLEHICGFGGVFGFGTRYRNNKHFQQNLEFEFVTGNASITLYPAKKYFPFLTDITYQIEYYF